MLGEPPRNKSSCHNVASSPGLPDFSRITLKDMGRPGDEATTMFKKSIYVASDTLVLGQCRWMVFPPFQTF